MALPLLATSVWTMAVLMFCAGLPIAPVVAALYGQIGRVAAPGSVAEAFSWFGTSVSIGIACGTVVGGAVIDGHGWRAAVILGIAFFGLGGGPDARPSLDARATLPTAVLRDCRTQVRAFTTWPF